MTFHIKMPLDSRVGSDLLLPQTHCSPKAVRKTCHCSVIIRTIIIIFISEHWSPRCLMTAPRAPRGCVRVVLVGLVAAPGGGAPSPSLLLSAIE